MKFQIKSFEEKVRSTAASRRAGKTIDEVIKLLRESKSIEDTFTIACQAERLNDHQEVVVG